MADFPRTMVGGVSLPRLLIGSNWFYGFSHQTYARSEMIKSNHDPKSIADVMAVFAEAGCDAFVSGAHEYTKEIVQRVQDKVGRKLIPILTPTLPVDQNDPGNDEVKRILDDVKDKGGVFCLPHQCTTDIILDKLNREFRFFDTYAKLIRERDMIPGLSTHDPFSVSIADESGADVETYIQLYNAAGFLMQIEVDWVMR